MNSETTSLISGRALGFGFVILIHVGLFYALMSGLSNTMVELLKGPMETEIIDEIKKDDVPPPPPPPDFKPPPPAFVDMPTVAFDSAPATTAIQNVTNEKVAPKPPPPPPAPVAATEPRQDPRRPITQPEYPATSVRLGEEGAVILKFMVMPNGRVDGDTISVVESSGSERLDKAAIAEARKAWKFIPGTKDGKPAATWHQFRVVFELKKARG
jgi:protein TonB